MQKINKLDKYKLCSPKNLNPKNNSQNKMAATEASVEINNLRSFIAKHQDHEENYPSDIQL